MSGIESKTNIRTRNAPKFSYPLGNYKDFRSSVSETGGRDQQIYFLLPNGFYTFDDHVVKLCRFSIIYNWINQICNHEESYLILYDKITNKDKMYTS